MRIHGCTEEPEGTHVVPPYLWITLDLGNVDGNDIFWGDCVFPVTNRGGFRRVHRSSRSRGAKPEGFPHDCDRIRQLGQIFQRNRPVPQYLIDLDPQFEENLGMFYHLVSYKGEESCVSPVSDHPHRSHGSKIYTQRTRCCLMTGDDECDQLRLVR